MSHSLTEKVSWPVVDTSDENFGEIYRKYVDYVWRALVHLGVHQSDVEDVAHDVFLTVRRRLPSFEGRSALRTWIYGICIRTVSDYRQRAFRRREILHDEMPEMSTGSAQEQERGRGELRKRLLSLLDGLKPQLRDVFVLYEVEELSMKEVAEVIDCPLQTAYSRLHKARAVLKEQLQAQGIVP